MGIQITQSENTSLLNSLWLLDEANAQAGFLDIKDNAYTEVQIVSLAEWGEIEDKVFRIPPTRRRVILDSMTTKKHDL
ncbi:hypothetical protein CXF72_13945 [Psychromonas sp. MB-3u-54]|uniref:hypothetical protein n=1 Tax=Psychromonas sp. MB-3u-54 TaxID=2058319 RepID=UPI000C3287E9|nr:hypothetical protein [Psychromonas sp. MB-3u-54]PKH02026.1 hypothetical protein CXF72_13945 [Psychromonas sp. MB-3u-54]